MFSRTLSSVTGLMLSGFILTGCQSHVTVPTAPTTPIIESNTATKPITQFDLQGKIGVRTPQQSGSAFFTWSQQDQEFQLELTGILGVGKTQIYGEPGRVTLNSAKTGLIEAETAEELLERATGWQAPITHLVEWVQGRASSEHATLNKDDLGRITHLEEDDWNVDFNYNDQAIQPNRLILKQALENGKENRITMLIQNR